LDAVLMVALKTKRNLKYLITRLVFCAKMDEKLSNSKCGLWLQ